VIRYDVKCLMCAGMLTVSPQAVFTLIRVWLSVAVYTV